jgi:heat shock protein HslJ
VALATASDARAEDQFRMLDGKQIRARVSGQDITDGPHRSLYLRPDGMIIGSESGSSWTGSWKIRNDRLCITLPSSTSLVCNEVWMSGA